jgi:hypothetical protein
MFADGRPEGLPSFFELILHTYQFPFHLFSSRDNVITDRATGVLSFIVKVFFQE